MPKLIAIIFALTVHLSAWAEPKDPLNYPLRQYGLMLGTAILGCLVSWAAKVRAGTVNAWNIMHLIGELCTSAFAGLMAFWICESFGSPPLVTASLVGIAGHMGTRAIAMFEAYAEKRWGKTFGTYRE